MHNYLSEVEYDPDKARSNLLKHGVSFAHGEQVLRDPFGVTIEDIQFVNERRYVTLGMDALGRVLVVVHTPRKDRVRLLSARKASPNEEKKYYA